MAPPNSPIPDCLRARAGLRVLASAAWLALAALWPSVAISQGHSPDQTQPPPPATGQPAPSVANPASPAAVPADSNQLPPSPLPDALPPGASEPALSPPPPATLPDIDAIPNSKRRNPETGDQVVVVLKDGQRLEGTFVARDSRQVEIRIGRVATKLDAPSVERVYVQESPLSRYRQMRELINNDDEDRLLLLAAWLQRQSLFAEALHELDTILKVNPNNIEASRLREIIERQRDLVNESAPASAENPDREAQRRAAEEFPERLTPQRFPLLTPEQVNLIKVYEVDLRDPPRLNIPRETVERLLRDHSDSALIPGTREGREAFMRLPPERILDIMFRVRARELYAQVQVVDQPKSMRQFKDKVHAAWLVNAAATTRCHGGTDAGRFRLTNYKPNSDESVYTNFLIIDQHRLADGRPLIDYEDPDRSILLEMALPREESRYPHPPVKGWSPVFRNRDARRYQQAVEWIRLMYRPRPDYGIEYPPEPVDTTGPNAPPQADDAAIPPADGPVER